jgi:hypothetical protein
LLADQVSIRDRIRDRFLAAKNCRATYDALVISFDRPERPPALFAGNAVRCQQVFTQAAQAGAAAFDQKNRLEGERKCKR